MQYMRAHGNTPGPTQRPVTAGAITAALASLPAGLVLWGSEALQSLGEALNIKPWLVLVLLFIAGTLAGGLYGRIFSRAANDRRGGWLFGISYGFLGWMLGPVTALQLIKEQPIAFGRSAMGLMAAHLIFGLCLGLFFPWVHKMLQREFGDMSWEEKRDGWYGSKKGMPTAQEESKK